MKYIKKVSASQLISSEGTIIDSMNPGDDQTVNAPSIHAVKDYYDIKTATFSDYITLYSGITVLGSEVYKCGNIAIINIDISKTSGSWSAGQVTLGSCSNKLTTWVYGSARAIDDSVSSTVITPAALVAIPNGDLRVYVSRTTTKVTGTIICFVNS